MSGVFFRTRVFLRTHDLTSVKIWSSSSSSSSSSSINLRKNLFENVADNEYFLFKKVYVSIIFSIFVKTASPLFEAFACPCDARTVGKYRCSVGVLNGRAGGNALKYNA